MYTVMLADDEVNIVQGLCRTLEWSAHGCTVVGIAYDGAQALEIAKKKTPDIIVTDITMPCMDGLELIEQVRKFAPDTGFIVLSCHEDFSFLRAALRMDVCDYLVKETMTRQEFYQSLEKTKGCLARRRELSSREVAQEDPEIARVLAYIRTNLSKRLTLPEVAQVAGMNSSYFSRCFKSKMGENFVDYMARLRVERAKEYLRCSPQSIDWVAEQCGYVNTSYFNAAFKRFTGTTPGAYRRETRKK